MHAQNGYVVEKLYEYLYRCTKGSANYAIVKVLLEKQKEFPNVKIEEIAYKADVTPSTVSKFCRQLGFSGFSEFRDNYVEIESDSFHTSWYGELSKVSESVEIHSILFQYDRSLNCLFKVGWGLLIKFVLFTVLPLKLLLTVGIFGLFTSIISSFILFTS